MQIDTYLTYTPKILLTKYISNKNVNEGDMARTLVRSIDADHGTESEQSHYILHLGLSQLSEINFEVTKAVARSEIPGGGGGG